MRVHVFRLPNGPFADSLQLAPRHSMGQLRQQLQKVGAIRQRRLADPDPQQAVSEQRQYQQQQAEQPQQLARREPAPLRAQVQRIGPLGAGGHTAQAAGALETAHRDELVHLDARRAGPAALVAVVARAAQATGRVTANAQWGQQAEQGQPGAIGTEVAAEPLPEGGSESSNPQPRHRPEIRVRLKKKAPIFMSAA